MSDSTARDRLLPYLLDRLTDDAPAGTRDGPASRSWSLKQTHAAVVRDLAWLLNTSAPVEGEGMEEFPETAKSVLNYGIPDLCGKLASGLDLAKLQKMLTQAIVRFEPRIVRNTLSVRLVDAEESHKPHAIVIEIRGQIWANPMPDALHVMTEFDLESGQCHLLDKQYG